MNLKDALSIYAEILTLKSKASKGMVETNTTALQIFLDLLILKSRVFNGEAIKH